MQKIRKFTIALVGGAFVTVLLPLCAAAWIYGYAHAYFHRKIKKLCKKYQWKAFSRS